MLKPDSHGAAMLPNRRCETLIAAAVLAAVTARAPAQRLLEALSRTSLPLPTATSMASGDVDGDGDLDFLLTVGGQCRLFLNGGYGNLTDATATRIPPAASSPVAMALGDVDGDGDLDIVLATGGRDGLLLNDGTGTFSDASSLMPTTLTPATSVALGDVDGDGDLDIVIGADNSQSRLYLNNVVPSGTFVDATAGSMPVNIDPTTSVALGDVDGDGDPDLVVGNRVAVNGSFLFPDALNQNRLYLNNGIGTFTDATNRLPAMFDATVSVVLGDIDGDNDLDIVFGNTAAISRGLCLGCPSYKYSNDPCRVLTNNGSGIFGEGTVPTISQVSAMSAGDIDGDGDLDVLFGTPSGVKLLLNDGAGNFTDASLQVPANVNLTAMLVADLDGDGDADLCAAPGLPLTNVSRQLHAPQPLRIGQNYTLDAYRRRFPATTGTDLVWPYLSFAPASIPFAPFGTVGIDPTQAFALPILAIQQPTGTASLSLAVPASPGLVGLNVFMQAFFIPGSQQPKLGNVLPEIVIQ